MNMKKRKSKSVLRKDMFREIKNTLPKFISIVFMIMLGVFVSVGMKITTPIMKETILRYIDESKLFDFRITSTYPLTAEDLKTVKSNPDVADAEISYSVKLPLKDHNVDFNVYSLSDNFDVPRLTEGRLPTHDDEIVVDSWLKKYYKIGDRLQLQHAIEKTFDRDDKLRTYQYVIVGFADSVEHIDLFNDNKSADADSMGIPQSFGFIDKENFKTDHFHSILVRSKGLAGLEFGTDTHRSKTEDLKRQMEKTLRGRPDEIYEEKRNEIKQKQRELEDNRFGLLAALSNASQLPADKVAEYKDNLTKVEKALREIQEGLDILVQPQYKVQTRYDIVPVNEFYQSADKLKTVSDIFSGFFFMIAILVSLTTMTRMVEEQRIQIGTLKALGYPNSKITAKYFVYGSLASTIGIVFGLIIGHLIVYPMVYGAYAKSYVLPKPVLSFQPLILLFICAIAYACTTASARIAVHNMLKKRVAVLMRGKPPKKGTRIFLERIRFLWKRMNFFQKVSFRNIFRYKARMWMTVIGIAGCTGLLFLGFSLKSSIVSIGDIQFDQLYKYNISMAYNPYSDANDLDRMEHKLKSFGIVKSIRDVYGENTEVEGATNRPVNNVNVIVIDDLNDFSDFVNFRNMDGERPNLKADGIFMTLKLARTLKATEGANVVVNLNGKDETFRVEAILENYVGHAIYMSRDYYESVVGKAPVHNTKLIRLRHGATTKQIKDMIQVLRDDKCVFSVDNLMTGRTILDLLSESMNMVVAVMVVCSVMLALVVLYNLTNINISERIRELSTIKVLGFFPMEVTTYIYRETLLLTILGQAMGLVLGNIMHSYVVWELPPETVMLDPSTYLRDYLISIGITFFITMAISVIIHQKLKHVNMVEAMKAIE